MPRPVGEIRRRLVVSGVTMGITLMVMDITGDPRAWVVVGGMLGKVMGQLRGHSWVLQAASLRGLLIRVIGSEEVSEAIVVVGAAGGDGTVHVLRHHLLLSPRWQLTGLPRSLY